MSRGNGRPPPRVPGSPRSGLWHGPGPRPKLCPRLRTAAYGAHPPRQCLIDLVRRTGHQAGPAPGGPAPPPGAPLTHGRRQQAGSRRARPGPAQPAGNLFQANARTKQGRVFSENPPHKTRVSGTRRRATVSHKNRSRPGPGRSQDNSRRPAPEPHGPGRPGQSNDEGLFPRRASQPRHSPLAAAPDPGIPAPAGGQTTSSSRRDHPRTRPAHVRRRRRHTGPKPPGVSGSRTCRASRVSGRKTPHRADTTPVTAGRAPPPPRSRFSRTRGNGAPPTAPADPLCCCQIARFQAGKDHRHRPRQPRLASWSRCRG